MKACFNTITAGRHRPIEEIIRWSGRAGFAALEIDHVHIVDALSRMQLNELKKRIADAGLDVASIMAFNLAPLDDPEPGIARIEEATRHAHGLGAPLLLVYCATNIPIEMSPEETLNRAAERAAEYAEIAAPIGIGLEPIGRTTLMGSPGAALKIAEKSGKSNVGIVIDTFHFHLSQIPESELRSIPRDKLLLVHVNDAEDLPLEELGDEHRLHTGRGVLPLVLLLQTLKEIGYDHYLSVEIFREEYWRQPVQQVVREAKHSLDAVLSEASLTVT